MIKKLFLCAALVGAFGLTSCVDDVETASVQAIRGAKAAQLKAAAEADKTDAEAELVLANAYKATKESAAAAKAAEAARIKAQAAYEQAQADYMNAKTAEAKELAAVNLETAKAKLEEEKVRLQEEQARLQATLAQYENEIAQAQLDAERAKKNLEDLIKNQAGKDYDRINTLYGYYETACENLKSLQDLLTDAKFNLAKIEAGIMDVEGGYQNFIDNLNSQIIQSEALIAGWEAELEILKSPDYEAAVAALPALKEQKVALTTDMRNALIDMNEKQAAMNEAKNAISNSAYMAAVNEFRRNSVDYPNNVDFYQVWSNSAPQNAVGNYCAVVYSDSESGTQRVEEYIPVFTNGSTTSEAIDFTSIYGGEYPVSCKVYSTPYFALIEGGADKLNAVFAENVTELTTAATKAAKKLTDETKLQGDLIAAQKAYEKAKKANTGLVPNDPNAPTLQAAQKDAAKKLLAAINAVTGAKTKFEDVTYAGYFDDKVAYNNALVMIDNRVASATTDKNLADNELAEAEANAENVKGSLATMTADASAFSELVASANEANKAFAESSAKYYDIKAQLEAVEGQIKAYETIATGDGTWSQSYVDQRIKTLESNIKAEQEQIAANKAEIAELEQKLQNVTDLTKEKLVAEYEAKIASYEARIEAQKQVVAEAKAALDAALAEDAPTEK